MTQKSSIDVVLSVAILLIAGFLLAPILSSGFLTDDFHALSLIGQKIDLDRPMSMDTLRGIAWFYGHQADERFQLWRPTVFLSFAVTLLLFGPEAEAHLWVSLLLHLLSTALLFHFLRALFREAPAWTIAGATILFATSPLVLESIAWPVARSETLSMVFGLAALIAKTNEPRRVVLPTILAAVALSCKDSSVVFFAALACIDYFPPRRSPEYLAQKPATRFLRATVRIIPLLVVGWLYLRLREQLFGSLSGANYAGKSFKDATIKELLEKYGISLGRFAAPISDNFIASDAWRWATQIVLGAATLVLAASGWKAARAERRGLVLLFLALFIVPFFLGIWVNEITAKLVGTRAVYASWAGFSILVVAALGRTAGRLRIAALLSASIVAAVGIVEVRPILSDYVAAGRDCEATLESLRQPIRELAPNRIERLAVLNYPVPDMFYFGGAFSMGGSIVGALTPPFLEKAVFPLKIAALDRPADRGHAYFLNVFSAKAPDGRPISNENLAVAVMSPEKDGRHLGRLIVRGRYAARTGIELAPVFPEDEAVLAFDGSSSAKEPRRFSVRARGFEPEVLAFVIFTPNHAPPEYLVDTKKLEPARVEADGSRVYTIVLPPPSDAEVAGVKDGDAFGWSVSARDGRGTVEAQTEARIFRVRK